jgi:hypothetical protein
VPRPLVSKLLDLLVYVLGVVGAVLGVSFLLSVPFGGSLPLVKLLLFVIGFVLLSYGTILLWPAKPRDDPQAPPRNETVGSRDSSPFESLLERLLSKLNDSYPPQQRFSPGLKVFAAGCSVLLVSYLMEAVLLVGYKQ